MPKHNRRDALESALELGENPLPQPPPDLPILLELRIDTQCTEPSKRVPAAIETVHQLALAFFTEGKMKPHLIQHALEEAARFWTRVDREKQEPPVVQWESESDDLFVCSSCNRMMLLQLLDDDTKPRYCPACRDVDSLVSAEPVMPLHRPVLKLIPGGR